MAVSRDTLFVHGSSVGGGSTTNNSSNHNTAAARPNNRGPVVGLDCTSACVSADMHGTAGTSTFCDPSCLPGWSSAGPRFGGHGCGAGDPTRFGTTCRQCYTSQQAALAEERRVSSPESMDFNPGVHVVMCSTENPPPASECSDGCKATADAVSKAVVCIPSHNLPLPATAAVSAASGYRRFAPARSSFAWILTSTLYIV